MSIATLPPQNHLNALRSFISRIRRTRSLPSAQATAHVEESVAALEKAIHDNEGGVPRSPSASSANGPPATICRRSAGDKRPRLHQRDATWSLGQSLRCEYLRARAFDGAVPEFSEWSLES